jgi:putative endonuclease
MPNSNYVYLLANRRNGAIYTGMTGSLPHRLQQHRDMLTPGFTKRYAVTKLVYYEQHQDVEFAIMREKQIKKWLRAWKIELIEKDNPEWRDLWFDLNR